MLETSHDKIFMNMTVYQYLWDFHSELIQQAKKIVPFMVPTENSGVMYQVNSKYLSKMNK